MATKIGWTGETWNPLTGCTKISPGCKNCYAERMAKRLQAMGQANYVNGFELTLHESALDKPLKMKKPRMIFVNSMSDLFHRSVPDSYIARVFDAMRQAHWHTFQVLTKRAERLTSIHTLEWPANVWMGVSVENEQYTDRIDYLRACGAAVKFVSFEPLIGRVGKPDLGGIDWAIVGGESGPGARQMDPVWAMELRNVCRAHGVAFYMKQMGGSHNKRDKLSDIPVGLRIREYPERKI
jgi:protein gp37